MWKEESIIIDRKYEVLAYNEESICPMCKHAISPKRLIAYGYLDDATRKCVSMMYLCTACYNTFVVKYIIGDDGSTWRQYCGPSTRKKRNFDDRISDLSPSFVRIYNDAKAAEEYGLLEICGLGYRKALEFLVKDYLCHQYPEDTEEIKSMLLGKVISTKIPDDNIKTVASRCAWLCNDQAHYVQKFEEYDLKMLKDLLDAVVYWISIQLITSEAAHIDKR